MAKNTKTPASKAGVSPYRQKLLKRLVFGYHAFHRPAGGACSRQLNFLVRIFHGNVIRDLTVCTLFVKAGNPKLLILLFDACQKPCGQLVGENVAYYRSAFFRRTLAFIRKMPVNRTSLHSSNG